LSRDDITREVADLREGRAGYLHVGVGTGIIDQPVSAACGAALKDSPAVRIKVTVASNAELMRDLRDGHLDLVVSGMPAAAPEDLVQELLKGDQYVVFAAADHPLAKRNRVTLAELAGERWALSGTDGLSRKRLERAFEDGGLAAPRVALEAPSLSVRLRVMATSRLLGFNSTAVLRQAARQFRFVEIPVRELTWYRRVGISRRKDAYLSPLAGRFIEILKKTAKAGAAEDNDVRDQPFQKYPSP
jgi:DNA-binding transcriptional LysR family regulator